METVHFLETLAATYESKLRQIPEQQQHYKFLLMMPSLSRNRQQRLHVNT
jgi:hypothetical protein